MKKGISHRPRLRLDRRSFLFGASALVLTSRKGWSQSEGNRQVVILHTNDTHSRLEPFDSGPFKGLGGMSRRMAAVSEVRRRYGRTLLVDGGDVFQGTPWFNEFQGTVDFEMMQRLGYHAQAIGNHEFDAGSDALARAIKGAPKLNPLVANYAITADSPLDGLVKPHMLIEQDGVKIGLFGLGVVLEGLVSKKNSPGITYQEPRQAARQSVEALRSQGAELVVCLSHLGIDGHAGEIGDRDWPKDVDGVDYVVGGHSHTFLEHPEIVVDNRGHATPIMQVGHSGVKLGHTVFNVTSQKAEIALGGRPKAILLG